MNRSQKKSEDILKNSSNIFVDVLNSENEVEELVEIELLNEELNEAELNYELNENSAMEALNIEATEETVKEEIILIMI